MKRTWEYYLGCVLLLIGIGLVGGYIWGKATGELVDLAANIRVLIFIPFAFIAGLSFMNRGKVKAGSNEE